MKLVVGLGNPENRYNFTRHNTGFLVLDYYFKVKGLKWSDKPRLGALWGREDDTIFIKPQEFYNNSGQVVAAYMNYYKIPASDMFAPGALPVRCPPSPRAPGEPRPHARFQESLWDLAPAAR